MLWEMLTESTLVVPCTMSNVKLLQLAFKSLATAGRQVSGSHAADKGAVTYWMVSIMVSCRRRLALLIHLRSTGLQCKVAGPHLRGGAPMRGNLQVAGQAGRADQVGLALQQLLRCGCRCAQRARRRADEAADQALRWFTHGLGSLGQRLLPDISHRALSSDACTHIPCLSPGQQSALMLCNALIQALQCSKARCERLLQAICDSPSDIARSRLPLELSLRGPASGGAGMSSSVWCTAAATEGCLTSAASLDKAPASVFIAACRYTTPLTQA